MIPASLTAPPSLVSLSSFASLSPSLLKASPAAASCRPKRVACQAAMPGPESQHKGNGRSNGLSSSHGQPLYTTAGGHPVSDDNTSITIGETGTLTMEDFHFFDKHAHFNRERVPERVVHAKGMGAFGQFEVTNDVSDICKAAFLSSVGKTTEVFARFSTVTGESGYADTQRDPRGFSVKFYTEEGNWDMVGNNTPVFFVRDAMKFPDLIHALKRNPKTHLKDANSFWDFLSLVPESVHQVLVTFSPRGVPDGFRHMNGYGSNTFRWVNKEGKSHWVKYHFKTDQGIKNMTHEEAVKMAGVDPDYSLRDLVEAIEKGDFPSWTFCVQVMPLEDAAKQKFDPFDVTKVWSHKDYPLREVGKMVLNRLPENYFAEVEQASFSPAHMPPGIEASPDRVLQARLFAYDDAARYRVGTNYLQVPVNKCPFSTANYQRDGAMNTTANGGGQVTYYPNSIQGTPQPDPTKEDFAPYNHPGGVVARYSPEMWRNQDDFEQPRKLWELLTETEQEQTVMNIAGHLGNAMPHLQERQVEVFRKVDEKLAEKVSQALGMKQKSPEPKTLVA